jgi:outer membrane receptor protein involved in Fe transport
MTFSCVLVTNPLGIYSLLRFCITLKKYHLIKKVVQMFKKNNHKKFAYSTLSLLLMSLYPLTGSAANTENLEEEVEVIEVTGSRIKRSDMATTTPITAIDGDVLRKTGALNISEALNKLPMLTPNLGDTSSNSDLKSGGFPGQSTQDLRGLGAERTLVLVDGRRHVASVPGTSIVDVSTIPMALVERVEIITGGASSIYGADAVSGVINIILKKDFQGTKVNVSAGVAGEGDGERFSLDLTHGRSIFEDTGNIAVNFSYYQSTEVQAKDRDYVNSSIAFLPNPLDPDGDIDGIPNRTSQTFMRLYNQSDRNFFINGVPSALNPDGSLRATTLGPGGLMGGEGNFSDWTDGGEYHGDYENQRLLVPTERFNFNVSLQQELSDNVNLFADAKYVSSSAESRTGGYAQYGWNNLSADYPFYTPEQQAEVDRNGAGLEFAGFFPELGASGIDYSNKLYQLVVGLEGEIADDFSWSISVQHGQSTSEDTALGDIYQDRWDKAVGDAWTPYDCSGDCVPVNVFQPLTDEMVNYLNVGEHTSKGVLKQSILAANITGDVVELPAGFIGFAAGMEYRKEVSERTPSEIRQQGLGTNYSLEKPLRGNYDVAEIYTEVRVPLLKDVFMAESLSVEGAVRYSDYSTAGGNTSWSVGGDWQPIEDIKFRSSYAKAARAPNVNETFASESYSGEWIADPCSPWLFNESAERQANCEAQLGDNIDNIPYWTWTNKNNTGNSELRVEVAHTLTVGAIIEPRFIENLDITLDYWDVKLEDQIDSFPLQTVVYGCADSNNFCEYIDRTDTGSLELVTLSQLNLAKHDVRGLDIEANYFVDFDQNGIVKLNTLWSKMIERNLQSSELSDPQNTVGSMSYPEWRGNVGITYQLGGFSTTLTSRYIGSQMMDLDTTEEDRYPNETGSIWYSDISMSYWLTDKMSVNLVVNNVFDKGTPQVPEANVGGANWEYGYTAGLFDTIGRYYTVYASYEF